jgi:NADH:ubiquinone oxidoreductase subunit F (NADH-binding)
MLKLLEKVHSGKGSRADLGVIREISECMRTASLCGLGQTAPNPVLSTLRFFENEYLDLVDARGPAAARQARRASATEHDWESF